jgi:hypothetical protein
MNTNKSVKIEILEANEEILGTSSHGLIMVAEFYRDEEMGAGFFDSLEAAYEHIRGYLNDEEIVDC